MTSGQFEMISGQFEVISGQFETRSHCGKPIIQRINPIYGDINGISQGWSRRRPQLGQDQSDLQWNRMRSNEVMHLGDQFSLLLTLNHSMGWKLIVYLRDWYTELINFHSVSLRSLHLIYSTDQFSLRLTPITPSHSGSLWLTNLLCFQLHCNSPSLTPLHWMSLLLTVFHCPSFHFTLMLRYCTVICNDREW